MRNIPITMFWLSILFGCGSGIMLIYHACYGNVYFAILHTFNVIVYIMCAYIWWLDIKLRS